MSTMSPDQWKQWATADAERRGLHALKPLLDGLAAGTARLRATEWQAPADRLTRPDTHAGDEDAGAGR